MMKSLHPMGGARAGLRTRGRTLLSGALTLALSAGLLVVAGGGVPANAATGTIVSLTFDDANADQLPAATKLKQAGLVGTFYLVSGFIGAPSYMTLSDVQTLVANGDEVAGHTISHPDLTTLSVPEATRQICNDRVNWANWKIPVKDFAYPFASANPAVETAAKNCGYNSARGLGDIKTRFDCTSCPVGETTPPADYYYTKAPDEVEKAWTLADLQKSVTQAEAKNNGSWVQLTFHHFCTGTAPACADPSTTPTIFNQFVDWLAPRAKTNGTVVKTVGAVIGGTTAPAVAGPVVPPAAPGTNGIQNPSLETIDPTTGLPQCYLAGGYGSNTPTWQVTSAAHTGSKAVTLTMANYSSGDAKLLPSLDLGQCAPSVTVGHTYTLSEWYKSTAPTQFAVYYRTANGLWQYWTSSPWFGVTATYTKASWVTPAIPAGATALSFGLNLFSNGTLTTDDFSMIDAAAPAAAPTTAAASAAKVSVASGASADLVAVPAVFTQTTVSTLPARTKAATGRRVSQNNVLPAPEPKLSGRFHRPAKSGHAPGDVTLRPFVVSPELTRG